MSFGVINRRVYIACRDKAFTVLNDSRCLGRKGQRDPFIGVQCLYFEFILIRRFSNQGLIRQYIITGTVCRVFVISLYPRAYGTKLSHVDCIRIGITGSYARNLTGLLTRADS